MQVGREVERGMAGSVLARLHAGFRYQWEGPASLRPSLRLEWRFVGIRWLGILVLAPGLLVLPLGMVQRADSYAVVIAAVLYNLVVQRLVLRHSSVIASGYVTMVGDALLNVAMVTVGGGFNSPFYYLLYTVTISAAMRYGYGPALLMAFLYAASDLIESVVLGGRPGAPFVFRSGFLTITAILAGYLREQAQRAEGALEHRLQQASRLNESTALIGASLELENVLRSVVDAAARLFECDLAAVFPSASLLDDPPGQAVISNQADAARFGEELRSSGLLDDPEAQLAAPRRATLDSGRLVAVLDLTLPARSPRLARLVVGGLPGGTLTVPDPDILRSFVERVALALEKASLYRTLAQRSADLQRAYADLAQAHEELLRVDEMKTDFLANVSHEIRTPLSSIRSFSEILLTYGGDEEVEREFLTIINSESERLTRLLNDVLDIAKIEAGRMQWNEGLVELGPLLDETARTYVVQMEEAGLTFKRDVDPDLPPVFGDRDRLQQVIGNLLNNAVKFTRGGTIRLRARFVDDQIDISVSDTGIGIAADDIGRIFDKFQQVGAVMTDKPKGTGLGLSICREIVEHHGGRIRVQSAMGQGSTFAFSLAVARDSEERRPLALAAAG